jgi:glutamate synthase domain-containing protein 1
VPDANRKRRGTIAQNIHEKIEEILCMCGIMGYFDKTGERHAELGATMMRMLTALGRRGPDSAGIAFYADHGNGATAVRIKLGDGGDYAARAGEIRQRVGALARIQESDQDGEHLRLVLDQVREPSGLQAAIEGVDPHVEVISLGRALEIIKQTGSPERLDERFHISRLSGTHAIAHTRLSTESRIDLSHSQPFWAHGTLDVASVHNGHITNYHKLRRQYEERGVRFYTENDSEIIGITLAESLAAGASFREALDGSLQLFDGSFSYLAATADEIGFAKDRFGFKPLVITESDELVALATEEHALRQAFGESVTTWEPPPGVVRTWRIDETQSAPLAASAGSTHGSR